MTTHADKIGAAEHRTLLLAGLAGCVVELGPGNERDLDLHRVVVEGQHPASKLGRHDRWMVT